MHTNRPSRSVRVRNKISNSLTGSTSRTILIAALITEGLVIIVAAILWGLFDLTISITPSWYAVRLGVLAAIPLLLLNEITLRYSQAFPSSTIARFSHEIVVPLCKNVSLGLAALLGILSGFGEELLFRGVLPPLITPYFGDYSAGLISSVLFAWVHFIGQELKFLTVIPIYIVVGFYFWWLYTITGDLVAVMVCHGLHNFLVINITRVRSSKMKPVA